MALYPATDAREYKGHDKASVSLAKLVKSVVMPVGHSKRDIENFSPITHASADFAPTCLIHGNADDVVSPMDSFKMYEELHRVGAHAELHMLDHAPHSISRDPVLAPVINKIMIGFFDRIFRPEETAFQIDVHGQVGVVDKNAVLAAQGALDAKAEAQLNGGGGAIASKL